MVNHNVRAELMEAFKNYIKQFPNYSPRTFEEIRPFLEVKEVNRGGYLLKIGKVCKDILFVEKGLFRVYYLDNGKEITRCFCKENSIVTSYFSLIHLEASEYAIQAVENSRVIRLPYRTLQDFYIKDLFWQQVGRITLEKEYLFTECQHRSQSVLSATDRYLQFMEKESALLQRIPLSYLASYLQIAPETLSRIRSKVARN